MQKVIGLTYDSKSHSDSVRLTRHVKVYGVSRCPVSEHKMVVLLSDGRILLWNLISIQKQVLELLYLLL